MGKERSSNGSELSFSEIQGRVCIVCFTLKRPVGGEGEKKFLRLCDRRSETNQKAKTIGAEGRLEDSKRAPAPSRDRLAYDRKEKVTQM